MAEACTKAIHSAVARKGAPGGAETGGYMGTLTLLVPLVLGIANTSLADAARTSEQPQDGRRIELLNLICQDQMYKNNAEKSGGLFPDSKEQELKQLKVYYPRWFGKEFDFKDCPKEYRGVL